MNMLRLYSTRARTTRSGGVQLDTGVSYLNAFIAVYLRCRRNVDYVGRRTRGVGVAFFLAGTFFLVGTFLSNYEFLRVFDTHKVQNKTVMFVCHPDDESIFGASALSPHTHVVVVTDANSSGSGADRREHLKRAMRLAKASWEMWDFPESHYQSPLACSGWSIRTQHIVIDRIELLLRSSEGLESIITHNMMGEYGHVDHRNLHKAVIKAYMLAYSGKISAPTLKVFMPWLNYSNHEDRLTSPPISCEETSTHKLLLDSYERDGSLSNAAIFRNICYDVCPASLYNSALLNADDFHSCDLETDSITHMSCDEHRHHEAFTTSFDRTVLVAEPDDEEVFWRQNVDRAFMTKLYPKLGTFAAVLDIGARRYNKRVKELIGVHTKYFQLEPFPPVELHNDGTLECIVQDVIEKYPQFVLYFDAVIDFGVLGWPPVALEKSEIEEYVRNIRALLKPGGLYVLKVDAGALERINFHENIQPYFDPVRFADFESELLLDERRTQVFFLRLK